MSRTPYSFVTTAMIAACVAATEPEDGPSDSFLSDGKADTGGINEGSPDALAILRVANRASVATLENDVGLAQRPAENIVAYRVGDDGAVGTADDRSFHTLAELDAVPYVGPIAFAHLLDYVHHHDTGASDPFDPASCPGDFAVPIERFAPGASTAVLGTYRLQRRVRSCTPVTGCGPWTAVDSFTCRTETSSGGISTGACPGSGVIAGTATLEVIGSSVYVELESDTDGTPLRGMHFAASGSTTQQPLQLGFYRLTSDGGVVDVLVGGLNQLALRGVITHRCLRLDDTSRDGTSQVAVLVDFGAP